MKHLIINGDDFGMSHLINQMMLELVAEGSLTGVSAMVDVIDETQSEQVQQLIELIKDRRCGIGLHVYFQNENFRDETERQYAKFREIFGDKPSHIDIHKPDHLRDGYSVIQQFCVEESLPCKNLSMFGDDIMTVPEVLTTETSIYEGSKKTFSEIIAWIESLPSGIHSINFHPGYYDPESDSSLNQERQDDADHIRQLVKILPEYDITLASFYELI